ncbi:hypothetical protein [Deinococcus sp.]|uniref:hypothetical protein n=1 Tax=Deinococcus sp. TaxID=47478 RepID=UPI003CC60A7F
MTAADRSRIARVLKIALDSPYEGEREKSVGLVLRLLERAGLRLRDIDASFAAGSGEAQLRARARLACEYLEFFRSREEALLYLHLFRRLAPAAPPPQPGEDARGYTLGCYASPETRQRLDAAFQGHLAQLQAALATAQAQALREYQARRRELFEQAVEQTAAAERLKRNPA